jgi:3',5'-cyclic-AMP phosphodiesterase
MLIAHLSDLHVFAAEKETANVRPDTVARVRRLVADVASFRPAIDAVVITGDVADGGSRENYALARRLLAPLRMPVFAVPGNHDSRTEMREAFAPLQRFEPGPYLTFRATVGPLRIVGLDSQIPGRVEGRLCHDRLAWAERALAEPHDGPTFLLMHHPPFASGMGAVDASGLVEGAHELAAVVAGLEGRASLLCGHVHRCFQTIWNGALAATGGSPAFTLDLAFGGSGEPPPRDEPFFYAIHTVGMRGAAIVHQRYVRL